MTRRPLLAAALGLPLAACVTTPAPPPPAHVQVEEKMLREPGLDRVLGRDARALVALFGAPDQDLHEGRARRLQFVGPACVLDAYLYPPEAGGEPVVTWLDARGRAGEDMDRASCIAALVRR